ncbi:DUF4084 domain-containing protein [Bacillus cereus group sp. BfR-BA-01233]|uniref:DUF4084 domain-containing protein n=1 Tax=Bacillus cereus group sp. BfR-BA-01233 TaxID=3094879 RepID=UPI0029C58B22|nr:DUF4084 domain-containing protein [Bacillus cereus group sp. BfR-BA-01233]MDX5844881.1 DUF4084 domain-containing protein [Bacillus cereus group sp. BfR-BA-01233]
MINQKKYVHFVIMYIIIFSLWIFLIPKDLNIKEIGILFLFCFATIFSCYCLYKAIKKMKRGDKLFWVLVLCTCLCGLTMEITLFLHSLSIYDQVIFSYKALPFFIVQYILLFSGFAIKFIKHYSIRGLAQFSFDSIFIVIMNIYFTLTFILDISSFRMLTTDTWVLIGYFIAQSLVIYAVISLYRREEYSSSRISLIIGFTIILVYGYIHLFQLNAGIKPSSEVSYLIHTASILLIGLSSILYILDKPIQHETKTKYYRFDYVRFILPYFSIIITFSFIIFQPWDDKFMLIGLVLSLILLFLRQLYMWKDNQALIDTYEQLTTQLEDKVEEGASALSKSEQRYKSLFEDHPDAVFSLNMYGIFQQSNTACESLFTAYYCEVESYSLLHFIDPKDHDLLQKALQLTKEGRPQTLEVRTKEKEGYYYYLHITLIPTFINKEVVGMFGIARDITTLYEKQKQVEHLAFHDALTGLPNRRKFEKDLKNILNTAQASANDVAVMFLDLDRFKKINDRLGHGVGDLLLIEVAKRLRSCLRSKDVVARQGGDEFTILLPDMYSEKSAAFIAEQILNILNKPFFIKDEELSITPSIGIAMSPDCGTDVTALMKNADMAMYRAKANGKNRFVFFSKEMSIAQNESNFLEGELSKALQQNEFFLEYQPQVSTKTKQVIGFEALIRWKHPKLGIVSPAQFIPLAEETGFIIELGNWILRTACLEAKRWHNQGFSHLKVGVNLSVVQFNHADLIPTISKVLEETELKPEALDIEITESIAINQNQSVVAKLEQLQNLGIQISIDDFGTGYSSLAYLTKYPINTLKIAREFICGITTSPLEEAIISSIITLSKELNLEVIAEGVETEEQWKFLYEQNCDHIQGFFISKPVSSKDVWRLLHKKTTV